jgi:hypothetical protein
MGRSGSPLAFASGIVGQVPPLARRGKARSKVRGWQRWLLDPRSAVLLVLALVLTFGGGRRLLKSWRARAALGRLNEGDVKTEEIASVVEFGRAGLFDLFRLLGTAESEAIRSAAGRAISVLWAKDELIAEEEKALVRRGYTVKWQARRRYPRAIGTEIPITVGYGVPFLSAAGRGIDPARLEWSHRITGARRASLETFSDWTPGHGRAEFSLVPGDFETRGPHKLVLETRVRTAGLTESWQLDLPHIPFSFEFDPLLSVDSLLALPDSSRAEAFAAAVQLARGESAFLNLNESLAIRQPPGLSVRTPLPCDLAHSVEVEFEGLAGRFPAGDVLLSGQGIGEPTVAASRHFPLASIAPVPADALERPGHRRFRAILTADPDRGWADPDVRSIWPGTIETDWIEVEVVRR